MGGFCLYAYTECVWTILGTFLDKNSRSVGFEHFALTEIKVTKLAPNLEIPSFDLTGIAHLCLILFIRTQPLSIGPILGGLPMVPQVGDIVGDKS